MARGRRKATIAALIADGVGCVRFDGYWISYRVAFDTLECVIPALVPSSALNPVTRNLPCLRDPAGATQVTQVERAELDG